MILENVKNRLTELNKDKTVVQTVRMEGSTKYLIETLAAMYNVTTNEIIKATLNALIDEAGEDELNQEMFPNISLDENGKTKFKDYAESIRSLFRSGSLSFEDLKEKK